MMKSKSITVVIRACLIFIVAAPPALASIKNSPHDLTALEQGDVCSFCHTPHGAISYTPLWNHKLSETVYKIYQSSSLDAKVGQPTGSSKTCLSCHDGTVALTHTQRKKGSGVYITPGESNIGTDLSDDHPISFVYTDELSVKDSQIRPASSLPEQLKLDRANELQCTTCHNAHENKYGHFLVMSNQGSQLCTSCHDLEEWDDSSHKNSTVSISGASDIYLKKSQYTTVADNGCGNCHRPHSAGGHERLLHFAKSEDSCLNCHNGSVARTNLRTAFSKPSRHNVYKYRNVHDLKESPIQSPRHVECVDCHNPHVVQDTIGQAPLVGGLMGKVSGVTASGGSTDRAQYEYEVCFKCHGDNPNRIESKITRQITQTNVRLEFDPGNPSYHPLISPGVNQNVPSLIPPLTVGSMIYCIDCHNSDDSTDTKGPHGSSYSPLLAYNYETSDFTQDNDFSYNLCYKCHSHNSILNNESFPKHSVHLEDEIPCSACHDAHGISSSQGTSLNNSHLINFDSSIVSADPVSGTLEFEDQGTFSGRCFLTCHGKNHSPEEY